MTKIYRPILLALSLPTHLAPLFRRSTGRAYGVGFIKKIGLLLKMVRNNIRIQSASNFLEHLAMATTILNIPATVRGSVVECGSYKGGSTTNLSLVCALCNRNLEVFDSFAGLPEPSESDQAHILLDRGEVHTYERGAWTGTLDEVKSTIKRYGAIEVCNFHVGYFDETLPHFARECVVVFADVDLTSSLETCVRYLWPLLVDGGYFYTHEATHLEIASLFFDKKWWRISLGTEAPGLVGAGTGLGLIPAAGGFRSSIGYTVKAQTVLDLEEVPQPGLDRDAGAGLGAS
jgi:O-methyltransferase